MKAYSHELRQPIPEGKGRLGDEEKMEIKEQKQTRKHQIYGIAANIQKSVKNSAVHSVRIGDKYWDVILKENVDVRKLIESSLEKIFPERFKP
jgi:hypothetical protein